jgi:3'(2'), 5'-bisphosphate nucleotidase
MIEVALRAALEAGEAILEIYARDIEVEYKADKSPLTAADRASHELITTALASTGFPVLSEEGRAIPYSERAAWSRFWLVDPIDGTKEFIKKNGEFTVNIALIEEGAPVLGVVYAPVLETLYWGVTDSPVSREQGLSPGAWKAEGCRTKSFSELLRSAVALEVGRSWGDRKKLCVVASRSHCGEATLAFIDQLEKKYGAVERLSMGSSLKLCLVAEGTAAIYPRLAPTMEWDTAAADAVVRAAGGALFEYNGECTATDYILGSRSLTMLRYNKADLLNPYFVVSGLRE